MTKMTNNPQKMTKDQVNGTLSAADDAPREKPQAQKEAPVERGGPKGPEPTRFGDWESGGRCTDF